MITNEQKTFTTAYFIFKTKSECCNTFQLFYRDLDRLMTTLSNLTHSFSFFIFRQFLAFFQWLSPFFRQYRTYSFPFFLVKTFLSWKLKFSNVFIDILPVCRLYVICTSFLTFLITCATKLRTSTIF